MRTSGKTELRCGFDQVLATPAVLRGITSDLIKAYAGEGVELVQESAGV